MKILVCCFLFAILLTERIAAIRRKPHILFIVADDLGWNDVGWQNSQIKTPYLDKLAKNGVILNSSYVQPICTPSLYVNDINSQIPKYKSSGCAGHIYKSGDIGQTRTSGNPEVGSGSMEESRNSFLTGVYPFRVGLQNGAIAPAQAKYMPLKYPTLPEKLKKMGYSTHMLGKWHLGFCNKRYTPTSRGFDSFMGFYSGGQDYYKHTKDNGYDFRFNTTVFYPPKNQYSTKTYAKRAVEIIRNNDAKKSPLFLYLSFQSVHTPLQVPKKYEKMYKHIHNKQRRIYSGMVTAMDDAVGAVITALKKNKYMNNLLIVFTTDNGGAAHVAGSNWPLRGSKTTLWEGGTRAISFVYSKNLLKTRRYVNSEMMHAVDWYPTLLAAAGGKPRKEKHIDGVNQWPMLKYGKSSARTEFVYSIDDVLNRAAIRVGDYKVIVGSPGIYNRWYRVPRGNRFCPTYDEYEENTEEEIFIYESLNNMVRNVKGAINWLATRLPGYGYWKKWRRIKEIQKCRRLKKYESQKWRFPKYLMYNLKDDPLEKHNIAGYKPKLFAKIKRRLDRYMKRMVKSQNKRRNKWANPIYYNNVWSPGWCPVVGSNKA